MSDRTLTRREGLGLLKAAQEALVRGAYPNPERSGCPDKSMLRAIAGRTISTDHLIESIDHIGFCSPCYTEYAALRRQVVIGQRIRVGAMAACLAVVSLLGLWLGLWHRHSIGKVETARHEEVASYWAYRLDLRNQGSVRGQAPIPNEYPAELPRERLSLSIDLPMGSEAGGYEFEIAQDPGKPIVSADGNADLRGGIATLNVKVNLGSLQAGTYLAGIRRHGLSWRYFPVLIK